MWVDLLVSIAHDGRKTSSRNGGSREIFGWSARLDDPWATAVTSKARNWSPSYAAAELLWYMGLNRDAAMIEAYAPSYANYTNGGLAMGHYGHRWRMNPGFAKARGAGDEIAFWQQSQLHAAVKLLRDKPDTRQAVVSMWDSGDLTQAIRGEWKDVPCTIALQFKGNGIGELDCAAFMRSNDAWKGFPYDVFCFAAIHRAVAASAGLGVGAYTHMVGSMHLYDKDLESAMRVIGDGGAHDRRAVDDATFASDLQQLQEAARVEPLARKLVARAKGSRVTALSDLLTGQETEWLGNLRAIDCHAIDLVRLCWRKILGREASEKLLGPVGPGPLRDLADRRGE